MAFKQPRVPEYRESEGTGKYIRSLVLFLKDFCMDVWTANNQRTGEISDAVKGYPVTSVCGKTGDVTLTAEDVGALPSGGTSVNASKLGGKAPEYYLQPRNLLDNSDFRKPVNQREKEEYTSNGYTIDRWELYSGVVGVSSLGYIATSGQMYQKIVIPTDKVYTFAIENNAGIALVTGIPANGIHSATLGNALIKLATIDEYVEVVIEPSEGYNLAGAYWAALYEGSYTAETLPPYVPKGYAAELEECRRYFRRYTANNASLILSGFVTSGAKNISVHAPELAPMRTKNVSIAYSGAGVIIRGVSGYATECSTGNAYGNISVSPYQNNSSFCATIDINKKDGTAWGLTNNTPVVVNFAANGTLDYIADL